MGRQKIWGKDGSNVGQGHLVHVALGHDLGQELAKVPQDDSIAEGKVANGRLNEPQAS